MLHAVTVRCPCHPSSIGAAAVACCFCRGADSATSPPTSASFWVMASSLALASAACCLSWSRAACFCCICVWSASLSVSRACVAASHKETSRREQRLTHGQAQAATGTPTSTGRLQSHPVCLVPSPCLSLHLVVARQVDEAHHVVQGDQHGRQRGRVAAGLLHQHSQQLQEEEQQALVQLQQLSLDVCATAGRSGGTQGDRAQ